MHKQMLHKPGATHTMECGCTLTYGDQASCAKKDSLRLDGQPVLEVIHKKCMACAKYSKERSSLVESVFARVIHETKGKDRRLIPSRFIAEMDRAYIEEFS